MISRASRRRRTQGIAVSIGELFDYCRGGCALPCWGPPSSPSHSAESWRHARLEAPPERHSRGARRAMRPALHSEDSTDESEREDDDYQRAVARYAALLRRAVRAAPPAGRLATAEVVSTPVAPRMAAAEALASPQSKPSSAALATHAGEWSR